MLSFLLELLMLSILITCSSPLCSPAEYSNKIRKLLSQQDDYDVYEGKLIFLSNKSYPQSNPSGVYGTIYFDDNDINNYDPNSFSRYEYFLRSSNALIFGGCTPPKSIYFSFVSYVMTRFNFNNNTNKTFLFASLGAALNNLVWNTTNSSNNNINYDSLTTVIQTGDQNTFNDIYKLLISLKEEINLQSLPNKYLYFTPYRYNANNITKYKSPYDTGTLCMRITLPQNKTEYNQYITTNQTVFMLQPKDINPNSTQPRMPYNVSIRNTYSSSNINEQLSIYNEILNEYKNDLIKYLSSSTTYNMTYFGDNKFHYSFGGCPNQTMCYGFGCIDDNTCCLGDNRDAWYTYPFSGDPYDANDVIYVTNYTFYIVLGIIHNNPVFNQTIYSNLVYYDHGLSPWKNDECPVMTMLDYNNSAIIWNKYIKTKIDEKYLKNIFVVQLAVNNNCLFQNESLLSNNFCLDDLTKSKYEYGGTINQRLYLNPVTKTRPCKDQLISSILLNFKLPQPAEL